MSMQEDYFRLPEAYRIARFGQSHQIQIHAIPIYIPGIEAVVDEKKRVTEADVVINDKKFVAKAA